MDEATKPIPVLLIGLDGFDPVLARRWMDEGKLPCLDRLRTEGLFSPLRSTIPPATFPAWTTFMTGANPGRHGLFDFARKRPGRYAVEFANAGHRRAPTVFRLLSAGGRRVGAMNLPATYPPEALNGFQIGGFDSPLATSIGPSFVHPVELYNVIVRRFSGFYAVAPFQESRIGRGWHAKALPALLDNLEKKIAVAEWLLSQEPWDCFMALFGEADTVSHHYWLYHDSASPRHDPSRAAALGGAIETVYRRLDAAVGRLRDAAGPERATLVLSDHGFGGTGLGVVHWNRWLAERGWLRFRAARHGALARATRRIGPLVAPRCVREAVFRVRGGALADAVESRARFGAIDWAHTLAYSEELNYFPSIRLNIANCEPQGALQEKDVGAFLDELRAALLDWKNPRTGEPIVRQVWRREELYRGPFVKEAPELILDLALDNGYSYSCLSSDGRPGPAYRELALGERMGAKNRSMNGSHRPFGMLLAGGCGIRRGSAADDPGLEDLASTILALQGFAAPETMDGRALREILSEQGGAGAPPVKLPGGVAGANASDHSAAMRKRLKDLGYLE